MKLFERKFESHSQVAGHIYLPAQGWVSERTKKTCKIKRKQN